METLRFLMVTTFYPPYHFGGDAVHVKYLAEALAERGHEVHVEFSPAAHFVKGDSTQTEGNDGVHVHPITSPLRGVQHLSAYIRGCSRGVTRFHNRLVGEVRPEVIHFHNLSLLGLDVISRGGAERTFYTAHDYWLRCPRSDLFKHGRHPCDAPTCGRCMLASLRLPQPWRRGKRWKALDELDWAIAPSDFMKRSIEGSLACPVVTIPNFAPDANPRVSIFRPDEYYLYVGDYERHMGLLELASTVAEFEDDVRFVFVGQGSLERQLRKLSHQGSNVDVMGWLQSSRIAPFYRGARGLIVPSLSPENSPLAAIEALSWGAPLLVSNRGGLGELVNGGGGVSFEPTAAGISSALEEFEAEAMPLVLRRRARFTYETRHHPVRFLERYMILIEEEGDEALEKMEEEAVTVDRLDSLPERGGPP